MIDEEEDEPTRIICAYRGNDADYLPDDKFGPCCLCGKELRFRPHVPEPSEKICVPCFKKDAFATSQVVTVTPETVADLLGIRRKG